MAPRLRKNRRIAPPVPAIAAGGEERNGIPLGGILLEFRHGLGDLVQLSVVLRHLHQANPHAPVDVVCDDAKVLSHSGFERQRFGFHNPRYHQGGWDQVISLDFPDCVDDLAGFPLTKAYKCLTEVLKLTPQLDLFTYSIVIGEAARASARKYLTQITGRELPDGERFPVVLIHYQGCSSRMHKDLANETVKVVCDAARLRGRTVAIFDQERNSPLVDQATVFAPLNGNPVWQTPGHADPETMAAIIDQVELFIGIDSGPLHLAGATKTPSLGVWTHHHPIRYYDIADNVTHLVPVGHRRLAGGIRAPEFFERTYKHVVYGNVTTALVEEMHKRLEGTFEPSRPRSDALPGLNATSFGEQYYTEHVNAGLDYLGHGDWQRDYAAWLVDVLDWKGKQICDVGCACGSILRGLGHVGAVVRGFDLSEYMVRRGRCKWPDQAGLMEVMDAVNLHLYADGQFEGLHSAQVAEHWKPDLVPFIVRELHRVLRPGGLFFCTLDTEELFARNNRTMEHEDKTHVCVKPLAWWEYQLESAGWDVITTEYLEALKAHPKSFLTRYDWDLFIARRKDD